ncbi:MAG: hypothetical protein QM529_03915 [Hydrotalea sp.]|nr:hypothetical protein [Hydrotalea sp.]
MKIRKNLLLAFTIGCYGLWLLASPSLVARAMAQALAQDNPSNSAANNSGYSDDINLSGSDGIKWNRATNNIIARGNSQLTRQGFMLKSQGQLMVMFKKIPATNKNQIDKITAVTMAELITDKLNGMAGQIELQFMPDPIKMNGEVVKTISFLTQVVLVTKKNTANNAATDKAATNMILYADKAVGYRNKQSQIKVSQPVPRDIAKNPFAELQASGAVKISEQQFDAKGQRFIWFFDDAIGWFYAPTVVVTTAGKGANSGNNTIYANQLLEYNQAANWARATHGVKVITKKNEIITGQHGYYFPAKQQFIVCGQVIIRRLNAKGKEETIEGQCANSDFKTGISTIEGKNIEKEMLAIVGQDAILASQPAKDGTGAPALKKLNNNPLDRRGRVRAIIDLN